MLPVCVLVAYALGIITTILFHPTTISKYTYSALKSTISFTPLFQITGPVAITTPFPSAFLEASKTRVNLQGGDWRSLAGLCTLSVVLVGISGYVYFLHVKHTLEVDSCQEDAKNYDLEVSKTNNEVNIKNLKSHIKGRDQQIIYLESLISNQNIQINELKPQLETKTEQNMNLLHKQGTDNDTILRLEAQMRYPTLAKERLERDVETHQITINNLKDLNATQNRQMMDQQREVARLQNSLAISNATKAEEIEKRRKTNEEHRALYKTWYEKLKSTTEKGKEEKERYNASLGKLQGRYNETIKGFEERDKKISVRDALIKRLEGLNDDLMAKLKESPIDDQEAASNDHPNNPKNRKKRERKKANKKAKASGQVVEADITDDASGNEAAEMEDGGEGSKTNKGTGEVGAKGKDPKKD